MLIKHWMTNEVITATPDTSVVKANRLMKEHNIRRLPVVDTEGHVVGIVSDRDIKDASPSQATSLDMREMLYLLSELKLKSIMTINPLCVNPEDSIEKVAILMEEKGFGGFPVTENDKLVGIISDHDIFKVLIEITGARQDSLQMAFSVQDKVGALRPVLETLAEHKANITSILSHTDENSAEKQVFIRIQRMESEAAQSALLDILKKEHTLLYWN